MADGGDHRFSGGSAIVVKEWCGSAIMQALGIT